MKRCYFSISDKNNLVHYEKLKNSLAKFTSDPLILIDEEKVKQLGDPYFYYRATPTIAKALLKEYDEVCKIDADSIITGQLSQIWEGDFDVGVVLNDLMYPIRVLDCDTYANNGLVVLKSKDFVDHWLRLCHSSHFNNFQYREQDLLSILTSDYFNYHIKWLDNGKIYGEWAKSFWPKTYLEKDDIFFDTPKGKKQLMVIHFGGGAGSPDKGNYKIRFPEAVCKVLDKLVKP